MKRREFVAGLSAAAGWPLAAAAQQPEGMRRIGVLMPLAEGDREGVSRVAAFVQELRQLGWMKDRNVRIETRFGAGSAAVRRHAAELIALAPDAILANGDSTVSVLLQSIHTVPIVFANVPDPVGAGFVDSLARPGGNATGFTLFEFGMSGKWLELLKEIAPDVTRVAVLRDPALASGGGQLGAIQSLAPAFGIELNPINVRDAGEIERALAAFAHLSNGGLIVTGSALAIAHRDVIISLAAQHKLPTVYFYRLFIPAGGLVAYGPNSVEQFRRAAGYVDRIFRGEKPADLPVLAPTKYDLVINLKTARTLGLTIPPTLLARADEVIE
jgi:putative ABC transport system substrate-binding protein